MKIPLVLLVTLCLIMISIKTDVEGRELVEKTLDFSLHGVTESKKDNNKHGDKKGKAVDDPTLGHPLGTRKNANDNSSSRRKGEVARAVQAAVVHGPPWNLQVNTYTWVAIMKVRVFSALKCVNVEACGCP